MNETKRLRVSRVRVSQILGIDELEIQLPERGLVQVAGRNGTGKTSLLSAIAASLKDRGATDATLLRHGAEAGESVVVLDNGVEVRKRVTATGGSIRVKHPETGVMGSPGKWLDGILDLPSFDMLGFLRAKPAERVEALARAFPVRLPDDFDDLVREPGIFTPEVIRDLKKKHPLDALAAVEKYAFTERTGVNRLAEDRRRTIQVTSEAVAGAEDMEAVEAAEEALEARQSAEADRLAGESAKAHADRDMAVKAIDHEHAEADAKIRGECAKTRAEVASAHEARISDLVAQIAKLQEQIAAAKRDREMAIAAIHAEEQRRTAESAADAGAKLKAAEEDRKARIDAVSALAKAAREKYAAERDALSVRRDAATRAASMRQLIAKSEAEAAEQEAQAKRLTEVVEGARKAKAGLLAALPIQGLEVRDGEVYMNGTAFPRLCEAERIRLAFDIAARTAGPLRLVVCDGAESLDAASLEALGRAAEEADVQLVTSYVDDGPFRVVGAGNGTKEA